MSVGVRSCDRAAVFAESPLCAFGSMKHDDSVFGCSLWEHHDGTSNSVALLMVARAFFEQLASAICCRFCDLVAVHSDTLHVKKLLHALDEIDVKLLLELGFGFGFNAVYKVTDVPWVVVEITQMFVNNQTALKSKAKDGEAVACGAARRCSGLEGRERRRVRCCLFVFSFSSRPRGRCERRIACLTWKNCLHVQSLPSR